MQTLYDREMSTPPLVAHDAAGIFAYTKVQKVYIDEFPVLFLPWHENAEELLPHPSEHSANEDAAETVVMGHIALNGARLTGWDHGGNAPGSHDNSSVLTAAHFTAFKKMFCGHYHTYAHYGEDKKVTYVGATAMQNHGDAHSSERGYILYKPDTGHSSLVRNPYAVHFVDIYCHDILSGGLDNEKVKHKQVRLLVDERTTIHQESHALAVIKQGDIANVKVVRRLRPHHAQTAQEPSAGDRPVENPRDFLQRLSSHFVRDCIPAEHQSEALTYISEVISKEVHETSRELFRADVATVRVVNFLGIHGRKTFNFGNLKPGLWMMLGENGAGKSQVIDAISWCLYKETFREVSKDEVRNNAASSGAECSVTVTFANHVVVRRTLTTLHVTKADGSVVENGSIKHTQQELETRILNCDWDTFKRSILLDSNDFLSLFSGSDKQRNIVIERLLGMEVLNTISKTVEEDASQMSVEQAKLSPDLTRLQFKIESLEERLLKDTQEADSLEKQLREIESTLGQEEAFALADGKEQTALKGRKDGLQATAQRVQGAFDDMLGRFNQALEASTTARTQVLAIESLHDSSAMERDDLTGRVTLARETVELALTEKATVKEELLKAESTTGRLAEELERMEDLGTDLRNRHNDIGVRLAEARDQVARHRDETLRCMGQLAQEEKSELACVIQRQTELHRERTEWNRKVREQKAARLEQRRKKRLSEEGARTMVEKFRSEENEYRRLLDDFNARQHEAAKLQENLRQQSERLAIPRIIEKALYHAEASGNPKTIIGITEDVIQPLNEIHDAMGRSCAPASLPEQGLIDRLQENLNHITIQGPPTADKLYSIQEDVRYAEALWTAARGELDDDVEEAGETATIQWDIELTGLGTHADGLRVRVSDIERRYRQERETEQGMLMSSLRSFSEEEDEGKQLLCAWEKEFRELRKSVRDSGTDRDHLAEHLAACSSKADAAEAQEWNLQELLRSAESRMVSDEEIRRLRNLAETIGRELADINGVFTSLRARLDENARLLHELDMDLENSRKRVAERREVIVRLKGEGDHARKLLHDLGDDISRGHSEKVALTEESTRLSCLLEELQKKHCIRQIWKNALATTNDTSARSKANLQQKGSFRQLCRKEHLSFLQTRFDEVLALLNDGNRDPRLACKLSENFQFHPQDGQAVAFNQRSGGEKKRTILGLLFTIMETLVTHGSMRPMILMVDEVLEQIDEAGRTSVLRYLKHFTQEHRSHRVILITHLEVPVACAGTIQVTAEGRWRLRKYEAVAHDGRKLDFDT
ncbi:hypothetical protein HDV00_003610 [Rhizophlyctis rosea]|nr:hypothetical protein HDV00_003610 [Rhizophlyctis rosea]